MNISIYTFHMNSGGAERVIANISNILSRDHKVVLKVLYNNQKGSFYKLSDSVKIDYITNSKPPSIGLLQNAIKSLNPLQSLSILLNYAFLFFLKYTCTIHSIKSERSDIIISDRIFFSRLFSKYAPDKIITIGQEHNHHNENFKYINKVISSCKNIDYFMPASQSLANFYSDKLDKTVVKYIPHSLTSFPDIKSTLIQKKFITVGRLVKGKGVDVLIDIFYTISIIDSEWSLLIIGDGPEKQTLENKVHKYNLTNRVTFTGNLNYEEVEKYYQNSSIYLSCSWTESFGLTFLEAASFGIPSIAFNSAQGAEEIIKESVSGFLIKDRDNEEYVKKALSLMNNDNLRFAFGDAAYEIAKYYHEDNVSKLWYSFIKDIEGEIK